MIDVVSALSWPDRRFTRHRGDKPDKPRGSRRANWLAVGRGLRMVFCGPGGRGVHSTSHSTSRLLARAREGDLSVAGDLFARHWDRLRRMVELRIDRRLQGRLDPSDVLQEAWTDFSQTLPEYVRNPAAPFYLWLRFLTGRKLRALHRRHLGARMRNAGREVSLEGRGFPPASSVTLANRLLGALSSPSQAAIRRERQAHVRKVLNKLKPLDREVLILRHFEQLTNQETAQVLRIGETAASNRYVRALERLKEGLELMPGGLEPPPAAGPGRGDPPPP